jgi:hypothetical protein
MPFPAPARTKHREDVPFDLVDGYMTFSDLDGLTLHVGLPEDLRADDIVMRNSSFPFFRKLVGEPTVQGDHHINWKVTRMDSNVTLGPNSFNILTPVTFFRAVPK